MMTCAAGGSLENSDEAGNVVERSIETHDLLDTVTVHDRRMNRVPCRKLSLSDDVILRPLYIHKFDRIDLLNQSQQNIERRSNCGRPIDSDIAVKDLLKDLRVRDQRRF